MKKLMQLLLVFGLILFLEETARGEVTDIRNQIKLCHEISDSLKRLTCYDNLSNDSFTKSIEFKDLLQVFSFDGDGTWKTGSDNNSINWLTKYPVDNKDPQYRSFAYIKKGRVLLLINGTSCEEAGDGFIPESPYWDIALMGAKVGISLVVISRPLSHCYPAGYFEKSYKSAKELGCKQMCREFEMYNTVYQVTLKIKKQSSF
jgi:hypothetical protein